mgnify:CR=1 FL=1
MVKTTYRHFLQSEAWAEYQRKLGKTVYYDEGNGWSYHAIEETGGGLKRLYCPYGPTLASAAALKPAVASLSNQAKTRGIDFLRLQPPASVVSPATLKRHGFRHVKYSQPAHTWQLNLNQEIEHIQAGMKQNTRNICRNYQKKGLSYRRSDDPAEIDHLLVLLHQVARHNQIKVHDDDYFRLQAESLMPESASLHFIEFEGKVIAAALAYHDGTTWYYAHAAATHEHRKLGASTALVGEMIKAAKAWQATTFDFYGITLSDDPEHPWAGFTRFKQSFGGEAVSLGETYELPIRSVPYTFYRILRQLRSHLS